VPFLQKPQTSKTHPRWFNSTGDTDRSPEATSIRLSFEIISNRKPI